MRLSKFASQKTKKNIQLKYELQQQHIHEDNKTKCQTAGVGGGGGFLGKRFSGTLSILSSSNNSGSVRSIVAGAHCAKRNSFGNGSCISSSDSISNTCSHQKRKSKKTRCFSSTVFRCCLPCRGGSGSAAPATSPPLTPELPVNSYSPTSDTKVKRKSSGKSAIELTTDGNESLIAAVKKHSLAETIRTSATTPISLKTLINDDEEDSQLQISAVDIAAAKLASGILPRRAEPETLSDTSISPTTAVLQLANNSASAASLLSATASLLKATTAANTQVTFVANKTTTTTQLSPTTPPNNTKSNYICQSSKVDQKSFVPITAYTTTSTTIATHPPLTPLTFSTSVASPTATVNTTATITTSSSTASSTPSRCCCPPPQTSPLPHIKEEEESEQLLQRQQSNNNDDEPTSDKQLPQKHQEQQHLQSLTQLDQPSPFTANPSGSSDSCTSLSATAVNTPTTSSITVGGCTPQELTNTSTPSPRIKHKFRKQHKSGWSRIILAPNSSIIPIGGSSNCAVADSSETLASSSNNSNSAATASVALSAAQTRLASSSATALATQQSSSSQLLSTSKMQAEQGSIGDLQKYHSRYLKNRRHTLANVR